MSRGVHRGSSATEVTLVRDFILIFMARRAHSVPFQLQTAAGRRCHKIKADEARLYEIQKMSDRSRALLIGCIPNSCLLVCKNANRLN